MIYALLLEQNKLFVGETFPGKSVEHMYVVNCAQLNDWTRKYYPLDIFWKGEGGEILDDEVLAFMNRFGSENVRGGSFSNLELDQRKLWKAMIQFNRRQHKCLLWC